MHSLQDTKSICMQEHLYGITKCICMALPNAEMHLYAGAVLVLSSINHQLVQLALIDFSLPHFFDLFSQDQDGPHRYPNRGQAQLSFTRCTI